MISKHCIGVDYFHTIRGIVQSGASFQTLIPTFEDPLPAIASWPNFKPLWLHRSNPKESLAVVNIPHLPRFRLSISNKRTL
jgi:hypothetical protein